VVQLILLGLGLGLLVPAMTSALLGSVDKSRSGIASGTLNTARQTGSVLGVAVFGSLAAGDVVSGLHSSVAVSIALSLAAVALAATLDPAR
jgi:MFS transporter, DHA2 family, methylenomycin A resistance protein